MDKTHRDAAKAFAAAHARDLAIEVREWQDTGLLRDGRLRELAAMLPGDSDALSLAESFAIRACLDVAAGLGVGATDGNVALTIGGDGRGGQR